MIKTGLCGKSKDREGLWPFNSGFSPAEAGFAREVRGHQRLFSGKLVFFRSFVGISGLEKKTSTLRIRALDFPRYSPSLASSVSVFLAKVGFTGLEVGEESKAGRRKGLEGRGRRARLRWRL